MKRTVTDIVDARAALFELFAHPGMQIVDILFGKKSARHARLVRDHEDVIAGVVQRLDRFGDARRPANAVRKSDIAGVFVEHAVAIEKGGGLSRFRHRRRHLPGALNRSRSTIPQMACAAVM